MKKHVSITSWSFIIGSAFFALDGIFQVVNEFSITSLLYLSGSILFVVGSIFLIPESSRNSSQDKNRF